MGKPGIEGDQGKPGEEVLCDYIKINFESYTNE